MKFPVIGFYLLLNITVSFFAKNKLAMAQSIKVDGTTATQLEDCPGNCIIRGGLQQGINLFHSFERFNVDAGTTVLFQDSGVNNIFGRVTGGEISQILGTLGISGGNANLFLLNPNGIIFGPNSSLDLNGSFLATTANAIKFGEQGFFNAAQDNIPLLTINPSVLFFANGNSGEIVNESRTPSGENALEQTSLGLRVPDGKSLLLVGGDVILNGGRVNAFGGRVELGGLAEAGEIKLNISDFNESISLSFPDEIQRADIHLNNKASIDVRFGDGGDIAINADNLEISGESRVEAGIREELGTANSQAGNITLNTTKRLEINNGSRITNQVLRKAKGTAGDININSDSLFISNSAILQTATFGIGDAGDIKIEVNNGLAQIGSSSGVNTSVGSSGVGDAGNIQIIAQEILLEDESSLNTNTFGIGDAGDIKIEVNNGLAQIISSSSVDTSVGSSGVGDAGNIQIIAQEILLEDESSLNTNTFGIGDAGDIKIEVNNGLAQIISSSSVNTSVGSSGVGDAGNIQIIAQEILLEDESRISTSTFGQGNAGNIDIFVEEDVKLSSGSRIFSSVSPGAIGDGRQINIEANNISLDSGSQLVANVRGRGEGGSISLNASNSVHITGFGTDGFSSGIVTATEAEGQGQGRAGNITVNTNSFSIADGAIVSSQTLSESDGGDIFITANTFEALNGGQIVASADSSGNAGNMTIRVADNIFLSGSDPNFADRFPNNIGNEAPGNSGFFASSRQDASGLGGDIIIEAGKLNIQKGAEIAVDSQGTGEGGIIELEANELTLNNGSITAATLTNQGGNITLNVDNILTFENSGEITATAGTEGGSGDGGNVTINSNFILAFPTDNNYQITAQASQGNGGKIQITTDSFFGTEFVNLDASSNAGIDGNVSVEVLEVDPARGLTELPDVPVDVAALLAQNICEVDNGEDGETSSFINIGRGGLPPNPYEPLDSNDDIFVDVQLPTEWREKNTENSSVSSQAREPIVEANTLIINEKGNVELVAKIPSKNSRCANNRN